MSSSIYGPFGITGGGGGNTIYNADDSLSNNRIVDGDGNDLTFTNVQELLLESNEETDINAGTELNLRALNGDADITASENVNILGTNGIRLRTPAHLAATTNVGDIFTLTNTTSSEGEWQQRPYEKIVIWAEESAAVTSNQLEWSFGNGATGQIGIPLPEDWEVYAFSYQADTASAGATVTIALVNIATNTNITTFTATGATNNVIYTELLTSPIALPAGICIGFRTVTEVGTNNDARVAVWLRR